jgi:Family of unknown function (DUF5681)
MSALDNGLESPAEPRVGYGNPPVATRFLPGVSGNPRGRPKGARNFNTIVAATVSERLTVTQNGRRKRITKLEAAVTQLVNRAAGGDLRSTQLLIGLIQTNETRPPDADSQPPQADDDVLRELHRRMRETAQ